MRRLPLDRATRQGFTLVEVLIVVVILGILAATVLPQFTSATEDAKESALKQNLQQIRSQIDLYRFQHNGMVPAQGSTLQDDLRKALLLTSEANGSTDGTLGPPTFSLGEGSFGPYLLGQFPPNPFNGKNSIFITTTNTQNISGDYGWWYNSSTGEIRACLPDSMVSRDADKTPLNRF
jgi:prepilin-type N-terminal cleavage/methylation domain-containing protein